MATTSKQYRDQREQPRRINKVSVSSPELNISNLTSVVQSLVVGKIHLWNLCHNGTPNGCVILFKRMNNKSMRLEGSLAKESMTHTSTHAISDGGITRTLVMPSPIIFRTFKKGTQTKWFLKNKVCP